LVRALR